MTISETMSTTTSNRVINEKGILDKDDFLKLLLVELQHQDPTDPMDSDKILSQTSQLATMESARNTQDALEKLSQVLAKNRSFEAVSAIGKMADLGSSEILIAESGGVIFDIYFQDDIRDGVIYISDVNGNVVKRIGLDEQPGGTLSFDWDGVSDGGARVEAGTYYVHAEYKNKTGEDKITRAGYYPITSVKFDEGKTFVKVGGNYIELDKIKEIF